MSRKAALTFELEAVSWDSCTFNLLKKLLGALSGLEHNRFFSQTVNSLEYPHIQLLVAIGENSFVSLVRRDLDELEHSLFSLGSHN